MSTNLEHTESSRIAPNNSDLRHTQLALEHSTVTFEVGPVGVFAVVEREDGRTDYAGPLPEATISALREVSR